MSSVQIPVHLRELLREVMAKRAPEMLPCISRLGDLSLRPEQVEPLQNALVAEMCENGLLPDDEPNERGLQLDELIGVVEGA